MYSHDAVRWDDVAINVDCDNIVTPDFLEKVNKIFAGDRGHYTMVTAKTDQGAMTGRIAVRLIEFLKQGGYDENCFGTGYQDVDLKNRWAKLRNMTMPSGRCERLQGITSCGGALPNDVSSWKTDRTLSKILNMSTATTGGRSWGQMNTLNSAIMSERTLKGILARNSAKLKGGRLGAATFIFTGPCVTNWLATVGKLPMPGAPAAAASPPARATPTPVPASPRPKRSLRPTSSAPKQQAARTATMGPPLVKARTMAGPERGVAPLRLISVDDVRRMNMPGAADDIAASDADETNIQNVDVRTLRGTASGLGGPAAAPTTTTEWPIAIMCTGLRRFVDYSDTESACAFHNKQAHAHCMTFMRLSTSVACPCK